MITVQPIAVPVAAQTVAQPELFICPFAIAIDTREQCPWPFANVVLGNQQWIVKREVKTLATADYSIVGFEDKILIERKADDFVSSIASERDRFEREHERMADVVAAGGYACVICERSLSSICDELDDPCSGRKVTSDMVLGTVATMPRRYNVPWIFVGDRSRAELLAFRILWKWFEEHHA